MNILLVNPAAPLYSPFSTSEKRPPLGLGCLAASLREAGHVVFLVDRYLDPVDFIASGYLNKEAIDVVGVSTNTVCYYDCLRIFYTVEGMRRRGEWRGMILAGGPHASVMPDSVPPFVDKVIIGEGEVAAVDALAGDGPRLIRAETIRDLDSLPRPAWDLFHKRPYHRRVEWFKDRPVFSLNTSRGCPFGCTFCSVGSIWGTRYCSQSPERIVDDMKFLRREYGARAFYFREDNFTLSKARVRAFCELLLAEDFRTKWVCESRVDSLDAELIELMHRAGLEAFYFGVESGSQRLLDFMHKGFKLEKVEEVFAACREAGVRSAASFIVGVPTETEEERRATLRFAEKLRPTTTWVNVFVGLPVSPLYQYVQEHDLVEYRDGKGILYLKGHDDLVDRFYDGNPNAKIPRGPGQDPKLIDLDCQFDGERALPGDISMPPELMAGVLTRQRYAERLAVPGMRVLDVGCGAGWRAARFADMGCRVTAVDIDPDAIRYARANHARKNVAYLAMDGGRLGLPDDSYDLVAAFELIEHMPVESARRFLAEAWRVLADGGWLVGATPPAPGRKGRDRRPDPCHLHEYSLTELKALLGRFADVSFPRIGPGTTFQARKLSGPRPKVSLVMGVYNGEKVLESTLRSVLDQDFTDFELVVIDDGSGDGTAAALERFPDGRIRYYRQSHSGLTVALNRGLAFARGEYIARIDAGDTAAPRRLGRQVEFLDAHPEVVLVGSAFRRIGPDGENLGADTILTGDEEIRRELPGGNQFMHGAVMFRAGPVREIGGYREFFRYSQDYDLWLRLMDRGKLANLPEELAGWRVDPSSITVSRSGEQKRFRELARKFHRQRRSEGFDDLELGRIELDLSGAPAPSGLSRRSDLAGFHFQWGKSQLLAGQLRPARRQFYLGLRQQPLKPRLWLYLAVSNLPLSVVERLRKLARGLRRAGVRLP